MLNHPPIIYEKLVHFVCEGIFIRYKCHGLNDGLFFYSVKIEAFLLAAEWYREASGTIGSNIHDYDMFSHNFPNSYPTHLQPRLTVSRMMIVLHERED